MRNETRLSRWTLYSWALIFLLTLFQVMQWTLLPRFLDIYYHLSVMKGFEDAGGYVTRAFWEYAPEGRPHLYPPLLHVWMWMLYKLGLGPISVGRLVDCVSFPALLATWYFVVSRLAAPRPAFWALVLFSSAYSAVLAAVTLSAFNLAFIFGLLALFEAERNGPRRAALLLGLCFYTHTLAAFLFLFAMALNAAFAPGKRTVYLRAALAGAVLGLPILAYQFRFREYFAFVNVKENDQLELDLAIYALLALSLFGWKVRQRPGRPATETSAGRRWALCLWLGMLPLIGTHQVRFFSGHGLAGTALLAALALDDLSQRFKKGARRAMLLSVFLILFLAFFSPHFKWDFQTGRKDLVWADRTLTRHLWLEGARNFRSNAFSIYFQEPYEEIASVIRENSEPDDILWTDFSYTAGILGTMAGRVTSSAMLAETKPFEQTDRLSDARILVWFRDREGKALPEMWPSAQRRGLKLLKETDMAYIFQNPKGYRKRQFPRPLVPSGLLWLLGALSLVIPASVFMPGPTRFPPL